MVKKIAVALLCTALGTSLYARDDISESKLFLGLELDGTKTNTDIDFVGAPSLGVDTSNKTTIEYGIRLGAEKEEWRTTLLYTYGNDDNDGLDETMHKGSILLDYFIWNSGSNDYNVKPYIGAHVGYMSYTLEQQNFQNSGINVTVADDSGVFYGGQAGIAMTISEVVQLDLSYRYSLTTLDNMAYDDAGIISPFLLESTLDNMGTIAFSINYFY